jgi:hypothetical protein
MSVHNVPPGPPTRYPAADLRELRLAAAAATRHLLTEDADLIDWTAPRTVQAFSAICRAANWNAVGNSAFRDAGDGLRDPCSGGFALLQLDLYGATALFETLVEHADAALLTALEDALVTVLDATWDPGVRAGLEFLLERFVCDVRDERAARAWQR